MPHRAVVATALVLALPLVAGAGITRRTVHGRMQSASETGRERGGFSMLVSDRSGGSHYERILAGAIRLHPSSVYRVVLLRSDGSGERDFGALRTGTFGIGAFRFDTRFNALPEGVQTITDYGGGTIEVRDGSDAVLTGPIPDFVEIGSGGGPGAAAIGWDRSSLGPPDESSDARGRVYALRMDLPAGGFEELRVLCWRLAAGATYTVVAIDGSNETEIGTFTTLGDLRLGGFRLATARGDTIAGGGVLGLEGREVEVRDADGTAVLTGQFPTIE
jgi:hypothetical protein